jgi:hypothetical protein
VQLHRQTAPLCPLPPRRTGCLGSVPS